MMRHFVAQSTTSPGVATARVHLLSGFEVTSPAGTIELPSVGSRLVAYLALQDRPVPRTAVARDLWPQATHDKGQASLRSTLWRIRKVCQQLVTSSQDRLTLGEDVDVDVDHLVKLSQDLEPSTDAASDERPPMGLFTAELLPDWGDDWVLFERERLRLVALHTLDRISARCHQQGDNWAAAEYALMAIRLEPLRESSHRALIRAHVAEGNLCDALSQYQRYRELLRAELDVEPTELMTELIASAGLQPQTIPG